MYNGEATLSMPTCQSVVEFTPILRELPSWPEMFGWILDVIAAGQDVGEAIATLPDVSDETRDTMRELAISALAPEMA